MPPNPQEEITVPEGLSSRQKQIYLAILKIDRGRKLQKEGQMELDILVGENGEKQVTEKVTKLAKRGQKKTKTWEPSSTYPDREEKILGFIRRKGEWCTVNTIRTAFKWDARIVTAALRSLEKQGKVKMVTKSGNPNAHPSIRPRKFQYWVLT
jgi:hypothetical protein